MLEDELNSHDINQPPLITLITKQVFAFAFVVSEKVNIFLNCLTYNYYVNYILKRF